ncbi:hypothetical protein Q5752_005909 [Cryptotrichosporon argae]
MSTYEEERLANIRENALLLSSLGLESTPKPAPLPAAKPKPTISPLEQAARRAARVRDRLARTAAPVRRSRRVAELDTMAAVGGPSRARGQAQRPSPSPEPRPLRPPMPRAVAPVIPPPTDEEFAPAPPPTRRADGRLVFEARWAGVFEPNLTPAEMFAGGAFGGGFFAETYSSVLRTTLPAEPDALGPLFAPFASDATASADAPNAPNAPADAHTGALAAARSALGLDPTTHLTNPAPDGALNRFGVRAGQSLAEWERAGWVWAQDPRGWAQWYVRFYAGRRCADDERQVRRWLKVAGPTGRFLRALLKKLAAAGGRDAVADEDVGRVLRQTLWQWAYVVNEAEWARYME